MTMQLEQYIELARNEKQPIGTRVIVVPNADVMQRLTQFYSGGSGGCAKIQLADCISTDESFLPMADIVFPQLRTTLDQNDKLCIATGLHAYLFLLNNEERGKAFAELKKIVDRPIGNAVILVSSVWKNDLHASFSHPGYESGRQLVYLEGGVETKHAEVVLVDRRWIEVHPPNCSSFKSYLETVGDFPINEDEQVVVALLDNDKKIAGLNDAVVQVHTLADFMRQFYGIDENLADNVLQWILDTARSNKAKTALKALCEYFFNDDLSSVLKTAPQKIADESDDVKRVALLWCLKHSIEKDSFLYLVLTEPELRSEEFIQFYAVHTPIKLLKNKNASIFARERKIALKEFGERSSPLIGQFLEQTRDIPLSLLSTWLNNDTKSEHQEYIKRFADLNDTTLYRSLDFYLCDYDYGTKELTEYFRRYRRYKLLNTLDTVFCTESYDKSSDSSFENMRSRDSELGQYSQDGKIALLVVDAMGAEYLPLLIGMSSLYSLKIEKHCAVLSRFPTSTAFNRINWEGEKLPEIKTLDNIVHDGAEKHQTKEYYENISEVLDKVFPEIFDAVSRNMNRFDRIILTSDHGASRLAVLAHNTDLARTLDNPTDEKPDDWRYIKVQKGKECPDGFIESLDGNYWVVRGYNRLPKQGGRQNELHGGYTPEEVLVPFIVFNKSTRIEQPKEPLKPIKQLVEKDDFDI